MQGKPIASIAEELNNLLTIVAMCTDELEAGPHPEALSDMRDAVRRGAALTRLLGGGAPRADESAPAVSDVVLASRPTVLVVDPEEDVRRSIASGAEGRWRVLQASSIADALQTLEDVRSIDVIVVDTSFGGRRLASKLVERYPSAAVLFTGGYTDDEPLKSELPQSDVSLLCRPFTPAVLLDRVAETVARRR